MRVLITGAAGMLGSAVVPAFVDAGHEVTATDLHPREVRGIPMNSLDVRDATSVTAAVERVRPDMVLHLAAETDLEICEASRDHAYSTNTVGTHNVAIACHKNHSSLVYISTAGVFDGEKVDGPYTEFDEARPINVYGRSKFLGEDYVSRIVPESFVIRAGWMIGGGDRDHKFVAKIVEQLRGGAKTVRAVTDKLGTPTYVRDFAQNLLELVATPYYGLYHMACIGEGSRFDVAREIVAHYGLDVEVVPVTSEAFALEYPAPRPRSEMMRNYMLDLRGLNRMRPWDVALGNYLEDAEFQI